MKDYICEIKFNNNVLFRLFIKKNKINQMQIQSIDKGSYQ